MRFLAPKLSGTHLTSILHPIPSKVNLWKTNKLLRLDRHVYCILLDRMEEDGYKLLPLLGRKAKQPKDFQPEDNFLPVWVMPRSKFQHEQVNFACADRGSGNSTIAYKPLACTGDRIKFGTIESIFSVRCKKTFDGPQLESLWLTVRPFQDLSVSDAKKDPYRNWPHVNTQVMYAADAKKSVALDVISVSELIAHATMWQAPAGTFHISTRTVVLTHLSKYIVK